MRLIVTALLFLGGLMNFYLGIGFMLDPAGAMVQFGLQAVDTRGLAAARADFTAFFVVAAVTMMIGAWKRNGPVLLVPAALFAIALLGRAVSAAVDGTVDAFWTPMAYEAAMVVLTSIGYRLLPTRTETGIRHEV